MKKKRHTNKNILVIIIFVSFLASCNSLFSNCVHDGIEFYYSSDIKLKNKIDITANPEFHAITGTAMHFIIRTDKKEAVRPVYINGENITVRIFRIEDVNTDGRPYPDMLVEIGKDEFVQGPEVNLYALEIIPQLTGKRHTAAINVADNQKGSITFITGKTVFEDLYRNIPANAFTLFSSKYITDPQEKKESYAVLADLLSGQLLFSPKYPPDLFWESEDFRNNYLKTVTSVSLKMEYINKALHLPRDIQKKLYYRRVDEPKTVEKLNEIKETKEYYSSMGFQGKQLVAFNRTRIGGKDIFTYLKDDVDIWCLHISLLKKTRVQKNIAELRKAGKDIWTYVCCNDGIDMNVLLTSYLPEARLLFWYMWQNDIDGFLYWSVNKWPEWNVIEDTRNNKKRKRLGDGILIYPDNRDTMKYNLSLRAMNIRAGIIDYAVFSSLAPDRKNEIMEMIGKYIKSPGRFSKKITDYERIIDLARSWID